MENNIDSYTYKGRFRITAILFVLSHIFIVGLLIIIIYSVIVEKRPDPLFHIWTYLFFLIVVIFSIFGYSLKCPACKKKLLLEENKTKYIRNNNSFFTSMTKSLYSGIFKKRCFCLNCDHKFKC